MNYWIRAYNHKRFRVADFIRDYGFIDWEMRNRYEVGDVVFLYATAPESRLTFMLEVTRVGMDTKNTVDDSAYYIAQQYYDQWLASRGQRKYVRYEFLKSLDCPALTLELLREHGLSAAPRSPRRMCPELVDYVMSHLQ
jgi:hypothetical protein